MMKMLRVGVHWGGRKREEEEKSRPRPVGRVEASDEAWLAGPGAAGWAGLKGLQSAVDLWELPSGPPSPPPPVEGAGGAGGGGRSEEAKKRRGGAAEGEGWL